MVFGVKFVVSKGEDLTPGLKMQSLSLSNCGLCSLPAGNKVQLWLSQVMGVSSCVGRGQQQERPTHLTDTQKQEPREIRTLDLELDPGRLPGVSSRSL